MSPALRELVRIFATAAFEELLEQARAEPVADSPEKLGSLSDPHKLAKPAGSDNDS